MRKPLLQVTGVEKRFPGTPAPAVRNFSLTLQSGEIYALVGESGSGKTTALRLIAGLTDPDRGSIRLKGREIFSSSLNLPCEKRRIGIVFQEAALFPNLSVLKNVSFGLQGTKNKRRSRAAEYLDLVGLRDLEKRFPHELSGGQRQRAALARALAMEPDLILMDEPFSSLDIRIKTSVVEQVREILKKTGMTALMVTHSIDEAFFLAQRIGVMRQGVLEQEGSADELYRTPVSGYVADFLGAANILTPPQIKGLWREKPAGSDCAIAAQEGSFLLRPEKIRLTTEHEPESLAGTIKRATFIGERREYVVSVPPVDLRVRTSADTIFPEGSSVQVMIQPEAFYRLGSANLL